MKQSIQKTSTVDGSIAPARTYAYAVQACNVVGCSRLSSTVMVQIPKDPPSTPMGLTATADSWDRVSVSWTDSSEATNYRVVRDGSTIDSSVTSTNYVDRAVSGSSTYSYAVTACNAAGCSGPSEAAVVTTPPSPPEETSTPTATATEDQIAISWSATPGATNYQVIRDGAPVVTVSSPGYTDTAVTPGSLHFYLVQSCNAAGCSAAGDPVVVRADAPAASCNGITLSPGTDIQSAIRAHPSGTTFCFSPGVYHVASTIVPKSNDVLWGSPGSVLTGDDTTSEAIRGYAGYQVDVTVRGLTFQHFVGDVGVLVLGHGWIAEGNTISYNDGVGLRSSTDAVVRDNSIHHNGQYGLAGGPQTNMLFEGNEIAYNNTHHYSSWNAGGTKIIKSSWVTFRGNYVHDNFGNALHCDTDCIHVTYEGNLVVRNQDVGILHEAGYDALVTNNVLIGNDYADVANTLFYGSQLYLNDSQNVEISGNLVRSTEPGMSGIGLYDVDRGTGPYGVYQIANDYVHDNVIELIRGGKTGLVGSTHAPTSTGANNRFDHNTYFVPNTGSGYFYWSTGKNALTWTGWQGKGQDTTGTMRD